jgi:hypothetical protein
MVARFSILDARCSMPAPRSHALTLSRSRAPDKIRGIREIRGEVYVVAFSACFAPLPRRSFGAKAGLWFPKLASLRLRGFALNPGTF